MSSSVTGMSGRHFGHVPIANLAVFVPNSLLPKEPTKILLMATTDGLKVTGQNTVTTKPFRFDSDAADGETGKMKHFAPFLPYVRFHTRGRNVSNVEDMGAMFGKATS